MNKRKILSKITVFAIILSFIAQTIFSSGMSLKTEADSPLNSDYDFAGKISSCLYNANCTAINMKVSLNNSDVGDITKVSAYIIPIYEDETQLNYSSRTACYSVNDGISSSFTVSIPVSALNDIDSLYNKVFTSKIALLAVKNDGTSRLIDFAQYVTNPDNKASITEPFPQHESVKGVGLLIPSDLEQLGCNYTSINVCLWNLLTVTDHGDDSIPYVYEGKKYYFIRKEIEMMDTVLYNCMLNGMGVYAILIMKTASDINPDSPSKYYSHPDSVDTVDICAVNMQDEESIQYYKAIITFLAQRYSGTSSTHGIFEGYIVGNEIGAAITWNDMGTKTLEQYVDEYVRWLRLTNTLVKSVWSNARVYASFDHDWTADKGADYMGFRNIDVLEALNEVAQLQGNFDWNITWHPYPENIFDPQTWNDSNSIDSFDTKYITFKNLQILPQYISQERFLYNGKQRSIILSEQGFTSSDNSEWNQKLQAAAYAYAFYKVISVGGIDMFSMNGHIDNEHEMGLSLGLWSAVKGSVNDADYQKEIYNVFKYIDTERTFEVTEECLKTISQSMGKEIIDWKQIIPEFDEEKIYEYCSRPAVTYVPSGEISNASGSRTLTSGTLDNLLATDDTQNLRLEKDNTLNKSVATVDAITNLYKPDIPYDYKGIQYTPTRAFNLSSSPILRITARGSGVSGVEEVEFIVRAYSGDNIAESKTVVGRMNEWTTFAVDLSEWSGIGAIDNIRVWVRCHADETFVGQLSVASIETLQSANLKNVVVETDTDNIQSPSETIHLTITNNGNTVLNDTVKIEGLNGVQFDKTSYKISLKPLESVNIPLKVKKLVVEDYSCGVLSAVVLGQKYSFNVTEICYSDFTVDSKEKVYLGTFENGFLDGWSMGDGVRDIMCTTTGYEHKAFPKAASTGESFLHVQRDYIGVILAGYATKNFRLIRDFSDYDTLYFDFYGYGGASKKYIIEVILTASDSTTKVYNLEYDPSVVDGKADEWLTYSIDLTEFEGIDNLESISIGYRGNDTAYFNGSWAGWFSIDNVYVTGKGTENGPPMVAVNTKITGVNAIAAYNEALSGKLITNTEYETLIENMSVEKTSAKNDSTFSPVGLYEADLRSIVLSASAVIVIIAVLGALAFIFRNKRRRHGN